MFYWLNGLGSVTGSTAIGGGGSGGGNVTPMKCIRNLSMSRVALLAQSAGHHQQQQQQHRGGSVLRYGFFVFPAIAFGLGCWQVQRLQWKLGLIAERQAGLAAPPSTLPSDLSLVDTLVKPFSPVQVQGEYNHSQAQYLMPRVYQGKSGVHVITPFRISSTGDTILINRGWVPAIHNNNNNNSNSNISNNNVTNQRIGSSNSNTVLDISDYSQPAGVLTVNGLLRRSETQGSFVPPNEPHQKKWYWLDIVGLANHVHAKPVLLDATAPAVPAAPLSSLSSSPSSSSSSSPSLSTTYPIGGQTITELRNPHLNYAITWFSLSAALTALTFLFVRKPVAQAAAGTTRKRRWL
jgi:surfeit locus 1 family protein